MTFTQEERRLLILYYSGSVADTADTLCFARRHSYDPRERDVIDGILRKVGGEDDGALFQGVIPESEGLHG